MIKLNIGCGNKKLDGFINIDIREDVRPDIVLDVSYLDGIKDGTIDYILASHVLEHFPHWLTETILKEWIKKIKIGGVLELVVPDIKASVKKLFNDKTFDVGIREIYGDQDYPFNYHCTGFSLFKLNTMLNDLRMRFEDCEIKKGSIIYIAEKIL